MPGVAVVTRRGRPRRRVERPGWRTVGFYRENSDGLMVVDATVGPGGGHGRANDRADVRLNAN